MVDLYKHPLQKNCWCVIRSVTTIKTISTLTKSIERCYPAKIRPSKLQVETQRSPAKSQGTLSKVISCPWLTLFQFPLQQFWCLGFFKLIKRQFMHTGLLVKCKQWRSWPQDLICLDEIFWTFLFTFIQDFNPFYLSPFTVYFYSQTDRKDYHIQLKSGDV